MNTISSLLKFIGGYISLIEGSKSSLKGGKLLGTSVTTAQWAAIGDGTFKGMNVGDYWTIGGVDWVIAHMNYWKGFGDTECTTNHLVIVPRVPLYNAVMNDSHVTTGAYVGSKMYTTNLASAISTIESAFGSSHILTHREYLKNAVTNGYESGGAWYDRKVDLMTEEMVYGTKEFKNVINGTNWPYNYTIDMTQLDLFRLNRNMICTRSHWWLRDVALASDFALVYNNGNCNNYSAGNSIGVRPAFAIKAAA